MNATDCAAIVLAAGLSSRMGSLKPLLPLGEGTIADHVIATFAANNVEVYLVVGYRKKEIAASIKDRSVNIVENPQYEQGMFTSVQAGVRRLRRSHKRFFVMPVDIPLVSPATVGQLMTEARSHPRSILYPTFGGRRGHPVLIPARLVEPILQWKKDGGLKALLSADMDFAEVPVRDSNVVFDVDGPDDFTELLGRLQRSPS